MLTVPFWGDNRVVGTGNASRTDFIGDGASADVGTL
jgi:hypothetical protein